MKSKLLYLLKRWWFYLGVVLLCAIPTGEWMGATGDHFYYGFPFPSAYVKHGNMGTGGTLSEGFLFFSDSSQPPSSGARTGWFIHPELVGIGLNIALLLSAVYGLTLLWQRFHHAK